MENAGFIMLLNWISTDMVQEILEKLMEIIREVINIYIMIHWCVY